MKSHNRIVYILLLFALLFAPLFSCVTTPRQRGDGSLVVLSALLPSSGGIPYGKSEKLIFVKKRGGEYDMTTFFFTDDVSGDLFYAYNVPPGCYAVAGGVYEMPQGEMSEQVILVFSRDSVRRATFCVAEQSVHVAGRVHFDYLPYDDSIADEFQKTLLKRYNPLIITGEAHHLNRVIHRYRVYMCNTGFLDTGNTRNLENRVRRELPEGGWRELLLNERE